ncbi:hypothetical protein TSA6c_16870 [Azospirillum sp. TSA6c]|uniref:hypothetical protein n=1 Tax=Azospirillum sp. TSA6c TaxID=709813 RepID=UPI000D611C58|nr:hypothetical protein [Azospirillum sp. TSA6c]PWC48111.1 hypothetical protein TSA6c_16870 [Azospirillum sp. TSA6c]
MFNITATGGDSRTLVITDTETGAVVRDPMLQKLTVQFQSDGQIVATGHIAVFAPDLEADRMDWVTLHPITRRSEALAALEFRDGARIEFAANGAAEVKPAPSPAKEKPSCDLSRVTALLTSDASSATKTIAALARAQLAEGRTIVVLGGQSDSYRMGRLLGLENNRSITIFGGYNVDHTTAHEQMSFDALLVDNAAAFSVPDFRKLVDWATRCGASRIFAVNPPAKPEKVTVALEAVFDARAMLHAVAKSMFGDDVPAPADDVSTTEMTEAIAFHLRLMATPIDPLMLGALSINEPLLANGTGKVIPPANFWTVIRPAAVARDAPLAKAVTTAEAGWSRTNAPVADTTLLPGGPDASVLVSCVEGVAQSGRGFMVLNDRMQAAWYERKYPNALDLVLDAAKAEMWSRKSSLSGVDMPATGRWVRIERCGKFFSVSTNLTSDGTSCGVLPTAHFQSVRDFVTQHLTGEQLTGEAWVGTANTASAAAIPIGPATGPAVAGVSVAGAAGPTLSAVSA